MSSKRESRQNVIYRRRQRAIDNALQNPRTHLNIRDDAHPAATARLRSIDEPFEAEVPKWLLGRHHLDALRPLESRLRAEPVAHRSQAEHLLDLATTGIAPHNARLDPAVQEFRVALDIGGQIEYLVTGEWQNPPYRLDDHGVMFT